MIASDTFVRSSAKTSGWWVPGDWPPDPDPVALHNALRQVSRPLVLVASDRGPAVAKGGHVILGETPPSAARKLPLAAYAPALPPDALGDSGFKTAYGLRYAYVAGAMANAITSVEMVEAAGRAGMIGFFGSAGLTVDAIREAVGRLRDRMGGRPFGVNLIHSPNEPDLEAATVDLYLAERVRLVSASAYLGLTAPLVLYRIKGIRRDDNGVIECPNRVVAKVSRVEVAEKFLSPPPEKILKQLVASGKVTAEEAELARSVSVADGLTAEADSGGHTDNRPALSLLPTMIALRDRIQEKYRYPRPVPVGLGGGIATPESTAAAFAMGAAYVLTGSVNQACVEAGTSEAVRKMLAQARQADVTMAPAADMFEMGVKVQVLKRGTMFPLRAAKLYELYSRHDSYGEIPADQRAILERDFFRSSFDEAWSDTRAFFEQRDPRQNIRAEQEPKHKMALVFRSYLGQSSGWATTGRPDRQIDYQIWCGPAMGAFNEWVKGTFLDLPENRKTVCVAMNLLMGAAVKLRAGWLSHQGVVLPSGIGRYVPLTLSEIDAFLDGSHDASPAKAAAFR